MNNHQHESVLELEPKWAEISRSVRKLADDCLDGPITDPSTPSQLAREALRMCDHLDRLHHDIRKELEFLDSAAAHHAGVTMDEHAIELAAVDQQRETHQAKAEISDILKALLMWRDDPAERVRR